MPRLNELAELFGEFSHDLHDYGIAEQFGGEKRFRETLQHAARFNVGERLESFGPAFDGARAQGSVIPPFESFSIVSHSCGLDAEIVWAFRRLNEHVGIVQVVANGAGGFDQVIRIDENGAIDIAAMRVANLRFADCFGKPVSDALKREIWRAETLRIFCGVLYVLDHRDVHIVEIDAPANRQQRRAALRANIGPRYEIVIKTTTTIHRVISDLKHGRGHRGKRPHIRRGHLRAHPVTKQRTVRVRPTHVNGGGSTYPIYRVVNGEHAQVAA